MIRDRFYSVCVGGDKWLSKLAEETLSLQDDICENKSKGSNSGKYHRTASNRHKQEQNTVVILTCYTGMDN